MIIISITIKSILPTKLVTALLESITVTIRTQKYFNVHIEYELSIKLPTFPNDHCKPIEHLYSKLPYSPYTDNSKILLTLIYSY